jgi:malonyl-CoA/methylmalonyl-CoA synthetase
VESIDKRANNPLQWLETPLAADPERHFLEIAGSARSMSYRELYELSGKLAASLATCGVIAGDRVSVQVDKSAEAVALYIACLRLGAILVPLNTAYRSAELEYFLSDSQSKLFIARPENHQDATVLAERSGVSCVQTLGAGGDGTLMEIVQQKVPSEFSPFCGSADEIATIIYTSGTTGRSKGAMLTRKNLYQNAVALAQVWQFTKEDTLLHALPLFHAHGLLISINTVLSCGSSMIFLPAFDAAEVCSLLPRCTVMMGVPTFYSRLLRHPSFDRECTRNMRIFISGSAPLSLETHQEFEKRTGHFILERYGMTETLILTAVRADGPRLRGSVGLPLPGTELRLSDQSTGAPLHAPDAVGEIQISGIDIRGYWRAPDKLASELTQDGYFATGDLGQVDVNGNVYIVGRAKDMIISGGYNVYPKEVENQLDRIPGVSESAVVGIPHPDFGEGVTAFVTQFAGAALDERSVIKTLSEQLAKFKHPKRVFIVDELPRNALGKVQKNVLRERHSDLYKETVFPAGKASASDLASLEFDGPIAIVTMHQDHRRNALSRALLERLTTAIEEAVQQQTRVVLLRARSGVKVWSSGLDIAEIPPTGIDPLEWENPLRRFIRTIESLPAPVIAMIEGSVWGGACEVVFACDIVTATPESSLALTPTRLGVPYSLGGMLSLLNTTNPRLAREMMFTAKPVLAGRLAQLGVINHLASAADIETETLQIARNIASNSPLAIAVSKEQLRILAGAHPISPDTFERIQSLRKRVYCSDDYSEGIRAFHEKREPKFTGSE